MINNKTSFLCILLAFALLLVLTALSGCDGSDTQSQSPAGQTAAVAPAPANPQTQQADAQAVGLDQLPADIEWLTNGSDPLFASAEAVKGGSFHTFLLSFPLTFRVVGPDSNSSFRSAILGNQLSLIGIHPNTLNIIPELATHWAFGSDKKSMYFRLDPRARWSDGHPVTAADFAYTLEFMRSKHIIAPWYNDYYTEEIDRVVVYDAHTLAVVGTKAQPDLHLKLGLGPTPRHFYDPLTNEFVKKYNWQIAPNTGPYQIKSFKKGKQVVFERNKSWWAQDLRFFKNRFNVDRVVYTVVRDFNLAWEYFKKSKLDVFGITLPTFWHNKSDTPEFKRGYIQKLWFFNDTPRSAAGMWLNQDKAIFQDPNVRYAFAHAMNIRKVIEQVLRNDYFRLEQGFMGYGDYTNTAIRARRFDLAQVDTYMQASGWQRGADGIWQKDGQRFAVEVVYSQEPHTPRLVVLKEEAKKAGVELNLQRLDPAASYKKVLEKKHTVAWSGWSTSLRPQYWEHYHSINAHRPQTNNITNTDDSEMDRLIEAYRASLEALERQDLSRRIQTRIHEIGAYVPTFMVPYVREAYWRWWRLPSVPGTRLSDSLFDPFSSMTGGLFWLDEKLREQTQAAMKAGDAFEPQTKIDTTYKTAPAE